MNVHIIDGHALLTIPEVVDAGHLGEVFDTMTDMVMDGHLKVTRTVRDVVKRLEPNGRAYIWAKTVVAGGHATPVDFQWHRAVQQEVQKAGFETGLDDIYADRTSSVVEVAALAHYRISNGLQTTVVTEDWADKPLRPALGKVCQVFGWPVCTLPAFLDAHGLGHCLI